MRQTIAQVSWRGATVYCAATPHLTLHDRSPWLTTLAKGFFFAQKIKTWLRDNHIQTLYIDPRWPWQNGYIESFHSHFREEYLNRGWFLNLREARVVIEDWRQHYNEERPPSRLGYLGMKDILANQKVSPQMDQHRCSSHCYRDEANVPGCPSLCCSTSQFDSDDVELTLN